MHVTDTSKLYASHPHLARIDKMWGTAQCRDYITQLLTDTRNGERRGFDPDHASTILKLLFEHDRAFPEHDRDHNGAWWLNELARREE